LNNRWIQGELLNSFLGIPRHFLGTELAEGASITFSFLEHDRPAEPGLCRFEHKELKVLAVIVDPYAPFAIVILEHKWIGQACHIRTNHDEELSLESL
jgi:hypothetical protein